MLPVENVEGAGDAVADIVLKRGLFAFRCFRAGGEARVAAIREELRLHGFGLIDEKCPQSLLQLAYPKGLVAYK